MKIKNILVILLITTLSIATFGFYFTVPNKISITYELRYYANDLLEGNALVANQTRVQDDEGNYSSQTVYYGATTATDKLHDVVGIVGNGVYTVDPDAETLVFESQLSHPGVESISSITTSSQYVGTETILGYTVYKRYDSVDNTTTYYSRDLDAILKIDFHDGHIFQATSVNEEATNSITLPEYDIVSYDPYKVSINELEENNLITSTQATEMRSIIPEPFHSAEIEAQYCEGD